MSVRTWTNLSNTVFEYPIAIAPSSEADLAVDVVAVAIVPEDVSARNAPRSITLEGLADLEMLQDPLEHITALHVALGPVREHVIDLNAVVRMDQEHQLSFDDQEGELGVINVVLREEGRR